MSYKTLKFMTVRELIEVLGTKDKDLRVDCLVSDNIHLLCLHNAEGAFDTITLAEPEQEDT